MIKCRSFIAAAAAALMVTGCFAPDKGGMEYTGEVTSAQAQTSAAVSDTTEAVPSQEETTTVAPAPVEEMDYSDGLATLTNYIDDTYMAKADMFHYTDDTAVAGVIKKAMAGEDITIAVIGGSITQGTISNGAGDSEVGFRTCYADLFFKWWEDMFPDITVNKINAGIGATGSYIGVHRLATDVLAYDPDLVLVEFAVNDAGSKTSRVTYENIVRNILSYKSNPAVIMLIMGQTNGSSDQENEIIVGAHYKLPMLSYANCINMLIADGVYSSPVLSGDTVHPSAMGHAIVGEILWKYLNNVYHNRDIYPSYEGFDRESLAPIGSEKYKDCAIIDSDDVEPDDYGTFEKSKKFAQFPNDYTSKEGDGGLTFTLTFRNLGVLYYRTTNGKGAKYDVYVDGEKVSTLNGDFPGGWGNYAEASEVFKSDAEAEHVVKFVKAGDSAGEEFTVLGLMVSK